MSLRVYTLHRVVELLRQIGELRRSAEADSKRVRSLEAKCKKSLGKKGDLAEENKDLKAQIAELREGRPGGAVSLKALSVDELHQRLSRIIQEI